MAESKHSAAKSRARIFEGKQCLQISMPIGGIGAGCVGLNGEGGIQDFSVRHKPSTSAVPDGWTFTPSAFALLHVKGSDPVTKLVEGPIPPEKIYDQGLQSQGYRRGGFEGIPRFANCRFEGQYPFGTVHLSDPNLPLEVEIEGWNPFIPLDDVNSGIPCAILDYTIRNASAKPVSLEFSYHLAHFAVGAQGEKGTRNKPIPEKGVFLYNTEPSDDPTSASLALVVAGHKPKIKASWFRGGWFDSISALWRQVSTGTFVENDGSLNDQGLSGRNGGSVLVEAILQPGQEISIPVVLAWHFPNSNLAEGVPKGVDPKPWRPFYVSQWKDAAEVAEHVLANLPSLYSRTKAFQQALYSTTIPDYAIDAIASNLAIIKSPTVLRQENGNLWCWEGCFTDRGSCHGSCTHVWNYAQAIPHLFPKLERTLREQEYFRSMDERGHVNFRSALPDGPTTHDFHAAADGQLGGILKFYRDWQICGDAEWMRRLYPLAKRSLDYCIETWDPKHEGALSEPHHNTYDIEFWGPDGMCTTVYLGALSAMRDLAKALGNEADAKTYGELAERSAAFLDSKLFNGEYYEQAVQRDGLRDTSFADDIKAKQAASSKDETDLLLIAEGPKYQYGTGCISDGVIGQWMAEIYGVETPLNKSNVESHLKSIFRHNFKQDLTDHACLQRPGYAIGKEPGLLLCSWPKGGKPTLPFVYSDEVWTGIEYQVASHMISVGLVKEGLKIVEGVRSRYDGHTRNPYNEYECGSYYARALASFAVLNALSGFRYLAVTKTLNLNPKLETDPFVTFFSTATAFGTVAIENDQLTIDVVEGELKVYEATVTWKGETRTVSVDKVIRAGDAVTLKVS